MVFSCFVVSRTVGCFVASMCEEKIRWGNHKKKRKKNNYTNKKKMSAPSFQVDVQSMDGSRVHRPRENAVSHPQGIESLSGGYGGYNGCGMSTSQVPELKVYGGACGAGGGAGGPRRIGLDIGTRYAVVLANNLAEGAEAAVTVDGHYQGTFRIDPLSRIAVTMHASEAAKGRRGRGYIFEGERGMYGGQGSGGLGMISVDFMPDSVKQGPYMGNSWGDFHTPPHGVLGYARKAAGLGGPSRAGCRDDDEGHTQSRMAGFTSDQRPITYAGAADRASLGNPDASYGVGQDAFQPAGFGQFAGMARSAAANDARIGGGAAGSTQRISVRIYPNNMVGGQSIHGGGGGGDVGAAMIGTASSGGFAPAPQPSAAGFGNDPTVPFTQRHVQSLNAISSQDRANSWHRLDPTSANHAFETAFQQ
jgi:hypothetical protein